MNADDIERRVETLREARVQAAAKKIGIVLGPKESVTKKPVATASKTKKPVAKASKTKKPPVKTTVTKKPPAKTTVTKRNELLDALSKYDIVISDITGTGFNKRVLNKDIIAAIDKSKKNSVKISKTKTPSPIPVQTKTPSPIPVKTKTPSPVPVKTKTKAAKIKETKRQNVKKLLAERKAAKTAKTKSDLELLSTAIGTRAIIKKTGASFGVPRVAKDAVDRIRITVSDNVSVDIIKKIIVISVKSASLNGRSTVLLEDVELGVFAHDTLV